MKSRSSFVLLIAIALIEVTAQAATSVTNGLVVHLKFEGDYKDTSGNALDGSSVGAPNFETGVLGQAVHILNTKDGNTNNYVTLGYPDQLKFGSDTTASDFSFSFWVKVFHQADDQAFISNKDWKSGGNLGFILASEGDGMKWNYRDDGGSGRKDSPDVAPQLEDTNWHNIIVTFQRTNTAVIYVDGQFVNSTSIAPDADKPIGSVDTDDRGLSVNLGQDGTGAYTDGGSAEINMLMDDLGIWRRVLTAQEAAEIYNKGTQGRTLDQEPPAASVKIVEQPANLSVTAGVGATFKVLASGEALTYQWAFNGANIPNATNSSYTITHTAPSDAGTYAVRVGGTGGNATSTPVTLAVSPAPTLCSLTNGLVALLPFDGDYSDASGHGVTGSPQGNPTFTTGFLGKAIHIVTTKDGATNDYVSLGNPDVLKFGSGATASDVSFSFWVKVNHQADDPAFIANKNWNAGSNPGWIIASQESGVKWNLRDDGGSGRRDSATVGPALEDGSWHHIAVTLQRTNTGDIYVDGVHLNSANAAPDSDKPVGTIDTDAADLAVNIGQDGQGTYTDGGSAEIDFLMDDLAIWRRVLTADEVVCIYTHGLAGLTFSVPLPTVSAPQFSRITRNQDGSITVEWTGGGTLQAAPTVLGPWTPVPGATSPYNFNPTTAALFGRIAKQ